MKRKILTASVAGLFVAALAMYVSGCGGSHSSGGSAPTGNPSFDVTTFDSGATFQ